MANLTLTDDIRIAALRHAGELTNGFSPYDQDGRILEFINRIYTELICGGSTFVPELNEPWPWARAAQPILLTLQPPFSTEQNQAVVSLTNGSTAGTFSPAPSASLGPLTGWFLRMDDRSDVYRIATHTAGSANFTLDLAYLDDTIAGSGFTAAKLDYTVAAPNSTPIVRLVEPIRIFAIQPYEANGEGKIQGISPDELHRRFPLFMLFILPNRAPAYFATIAESQGSFTVRMNSTTTSASRAEVEYIPMPSALTLSGTPANDPLPVVPVEHRSVLAYGAAYWLMVDKRDPRQDLFMRLTQQKIQAMLLERRREYEDESKDFARLNPRQDHYWRPYVRSTSGIRFP